MYEVTKIGKLTEADSRVIIARDWVGRGNEELFEGYNFSVMKDKGILNAYIEAALEITVC